jgi:hypothetical protein
VQRHSLCPNCSFPVPRQWAFKSIVRTCPRCFASIRPLSVRRNRRGQVFFAFVVALTLIVVAVGVIVLNAGGELLGALLIGGACFVPLISLPWVPEDYERVDPQCPKCSYSLVGNVSGASPECGTPVPGCDTSVTASSCSNKDQ